MLAQEVARLLLGGDEVGVAVGQQVADAAVHILADDAALALAHGVEADEVDSLPLSTFHFPLFTYVLRHMAVGHAAVGFSLCQQAFVQQAVVVVERTVEGQVVALEGGQLRALDVPLADAFQVMQVAEEVGGVDAVLVQLREVAHHQVAERDKLVERLVFTLLAAQLGMDAVELEEQELVGHYLQAAQLGHQVVDDHGAGQEHGAAQPVELSLEEAHRAAVVHHHQHAVGILGVGVGDATCYLTEETVHCSACLRVSGLPTSSQWAGSCR